MTRTFATPSSGMKAFTKALAKGEIVVPLFRSMLMEPTYPDFMIEINGVQDGKDREYDGWFHPSTHPLWTQRQLYYYLVAPEALIYEPFGYEGTVAVNQGKFFHSFFQNLGIHHKILKPNDGQHCIECAQHRAEVYAEDIEAGSRGHADGELTIERAEGDLLELKTMNPSKIRKLSDLGDHPEQIETFIRLCPDYYAQAQDYLRMLGRDRTIVVLINPSYPFVLKEFHIPFDKNFTHKLRTKYMLVREMAKQTIPLADPCCGPRSKESKQCLARGVCPIAAA